MPPDEVDDRRPPPGGEPAPAFARPLALLVLALVLTWGGAVLRGGFAHDDSEAVRGNPLVEGALPWPRAFLQDAWHHLGDAGQYRPLAVLSLRLDRATWGEDARGFHLTTALLHLYVVLFAALLLRRTMPGGRVPWLGLCVFALHPALADSVAWISGRTSSVSALFGLAGALGVVHARGRSALTAGAAGAGLFLALLGKEDALVFGVLYVLLAVHARGTHSALRAALPALTGCALAALAWLALRRLALGAHWTEAPHAPLRGLSAAERLPFGGRALVEALRLAVLPLGYPPSYRAAPGFTPGTGSALFLLGWLPWLAARALGARSLVRSARGCGPRPAPRPAAASALLAALAVLPVLQLVPAGEVFAPRFLYLPLLFGVPLVQAAAERVLAPLPARARLPVAAVALVALGVLAAERSRVYAGREAYARATLAAVPEDAGAWNNLGLAREEAGDPDGARAAYENAARAEPGYARAWSNLGRLAYAAGELDRAEAAWTRAVLLGPKNAIARCNLAKLRLDAGRADEAAALYREATELAPGLAAAWRGLGHALVRAGRPSEAREALRRALRLAPGDAAARELLERAE